MSCSDISGGDVAIISAGWMKKSNTSSGGRGSVRDFSNSGMTTSSSVPGFPSGANSRYYHNGSRMRRGGRVDRELFDEALILTGPTGSGKTELSLRLAERLGAE